MRKRLIVLATALAFACLLAPNVAFASAVPVTIEVGADGAPVGTSGEGWTYADGKLTLDAGCAFTFTGHALNVSSENLLRNKGVIEDGAFVDASQAYGFAVRNEASGVIRGGTFTASIGNAGTIAGGTFNSDPNDPAKSYVSTSSGTITGGTFDCMVMGMRSGAIEDGTFNGSVTNHGTIAGGTFLSDVTNRGVIEGGIFENVISDQGGTVTSCAYPLRANLTGLSIAAVPSAMPKNTAAGFPAEPSAALTAAFEKDGADANLYQLSANEGYLLPDAIDVRCGAADGQTLALAAGTDYTYDPATGAIAIKKSVVTGPLLLAAQGAAAPTPPVPPTPDTPAPAPEPETPAPKPESKPDAPKPLPSTTDSKQAPANAAALAATGDAPLPQIALGIALLAGGVTLTCAIAMQITRKKRSNRS